MTYTCSPDNKPESVGSIPQSPSDSTFQGRINGDMFDELSRFDILNVAQRIYKSRYVELQWAGVQITPNKLKRVCPGASK